MITTTGMMTTSFKIGLAAVLLLAGNPLRAQNGIHLDAERREATGTLIAVGLNQRLARLKTDSGDTIPLKAGPEVENFDQLKQGDRVRVVYLEPVAVDMAKSDKAFSAPAGKRYEVEDVLVGTEEIGVQVADVDKGEGALKVQRPDGRESEVKADEQKIDLDQVGIGDQILLRRTEAVAVEIQRLAR